MSGCFEDASIPGWGADSIPLLDYDIDTAPWGQGSAASVFYGRLRRPDQRQGVAVWTKAGQPRMLPEEVCLKVLTKTEHGSKSELAALQKEVAIMANVQGHPNVVAFYGVGLLGGTMPEAWAMQMEFCSGGDLYNAVSEKRFSETEAHCVMLEILAGLVHMHECGFVHRDVKPENVLLAQDGTAKLSDFGISARLTDTDAMSKRCGSPGYVAPEIVLKADYGIKVDSFSAGALLHFIISGKTAFSGKNVQAVMRKTLQNPVDFRKSVCLERLSMPCKEFMKIMLCKDPDGRPTASEALCMMDSWSMEAQQDAVVGVYLAEMPLECCRMTNDSGAASTEYRESTKRSNATSCRYTSEQSTVALEEGHSQQGQKNNLVERSYEDVTMMSEIKAPERRHARPRQPVTPPPVPSTRSPALRMFKKSGADAYPPSEPTSPKAEKSAARDAETGGTGAALRMLV